MKDRPSGATRRVEQACRGDEQAFARLAQEHYSTVYGLAYSTVGNWSAAQDIAQETFLLAWSRRETLRHAPAFPAWVRRIASNLAKNWVRSAVYRRRLAEHFEAGAARESSPSMRPDAQADACERRDEVWRALESLTPALRQAVVLYHLHGESLREVAAALGISENAAKKRLQHGREKLRAHFEEQWRTEMAQQCEAVRSRDAGREFLSGLALGPAVPELGQTAAATGFGLWWEMAQETFLGGTVLSGKKAVVGGVACLLAMGSVYWAAVHPEGEPAAPETTLPRTVAAGAASSVPDVKPLEAISTEPTLTAATNTLAQYPPAQDPKGVLQAEAATSPPDPFQIPTVIPDPKDYAWVEGSVVDEKGAPIAGAEVTLAALGLPQPGENESRETLLARASAYQSRLANRDHYWSSLTDERGIFLIEGIRFAGLAILMARAPERRAAMETLQIEPASSPESVTLKLLPGVTIRGCLLSTDGKPVSDGLVRLVGFMTESGGQGGVIGLAVFTDPQGCFELDVEGPGTLSLLADSPTCGAATFTSVPADPLEMLRLQYPAEAVVFGRVTDDSANPIPEAEVRLVGSIVTRLDRPDGMGGMSSTMGATRSEVTDGDGRYRIEKVDTGQQYMASVVSKEGLELIQYVALKDLRPGYEHEVNLSVRPRITIQGVVRTAKAGHPMPGVAVIAFPSPAPSTSGGGAVGVVTALTAGDGTYTLTIAGDGGFFNILASYATNGMGFGGSGSPDAETLALKPGDTVTLDLELPDPATRSFQVVDTDGAPISGATVGVVTQSNGGTSGYGISSTTDADGRITITTIAPGSEIFADFGRADYLTARSESRICEAGEVLPEETVIMYRHAGLTATVVGPDGLPLTDTEIHVEAVYGEGQTAHASVRTDGNGELRVLDDLPATEVRIKVYAQRDSNDRDFMLTGDAATVTLDADKPTDLGTIALENVANG